MIHDRELNLSDGLLLRSDRYDALLQQGLTKLELAEKGIHKIHESFRIIALAEPPNTTNSSQNWLTPEMLSLFMYLEVRPLQQSEEYEIMYKLYGNIDPSIKKIIELSHLLRKSSDQTLAGTLSTKQLLKIARRMTSFSNDDTSNPLNSPYEIVQNTFLAKFMPALPKATLENAIQQVGIQKPSSSRTKRKITLEGDLLTIGNTQMKLEPTDEKSKVPSTLFYEMPQHVELLERLLQDFLIGDHLLLVGNQGVGKNKLIDKLLQLMNKPREYLQLHRDTTVHSLTVQSSLKDGQVVFEDSPLVKAVKNGHILVIDEVDKAPVNVTCILRTLVRFHFVSYFLYKSSFGPDYQ